VVGVVVWVVDKGDRLGLGVGLGVGDGAGLGEGGWEAPVML